jgi:hypothetical protein
MLTKSVLAKNRRVFEIRSTRQEGELSSDKTLTRATSRVGESSPRYSSPSTPPPDPTSLIAAAWRSIVDTPPCCHSVRFLKPKKAPPLLAFNTLSYTTFRRSLALNFRSEGISSSSRYFPFFFGDVGKLFAGNPKQRCGWDSETTSGKVA